VQGSPVGRAALTYMNSTTSLNREEPAESIAVRFSALQDQPEELRDQPTELGSLAALLASFRHTPPHRPKWPS
jgi:hypothetical protein